VNWPISITKSTRESILIHHPKYQTYLNQSISVSQSIIQSINQLFSPLQTTAEDIKVHSKSSSAGKYRSKSCERGNYAPLYNVLKSSTSPTLQSCSWRRIFCPKQT